MSTPIIQIKNLGKRYKISHERGKYIALRDVFASALRKPFSFLKQKIKQASGFEKREEFWALRNINFDVNRGEVIGIIGHNGAGKSTLLKILSQITPPTEGEVIVRGKVGSLLEVGTGFHPELTGRENIFLNGAILGMSRKEIASKFDQIVEFAGIDKFLDTPVKYYSSGMYVRLAFSVAAHMEPDILIVDEVLAVGDAEFQKKCLGKMDDITRTTGRTILFVSHNMAAIQTLCKRSVLLKNGCVAAYGDTPEIIEQYLSQIKDDRDLRITKKGLSRSGHDIDVTSLSLLNHSGESVKVLGTGESATVQISYKANKSVGREVEISVAIESVTGNRITQLSNSFTQDKLSIKDKGVFECFIPKVPINTGIYSISIYMTIDKEAVYWAKNVLHLSIEDGNFFGHGRNPAEHDGVILIDQKWSAS